MECHCAMYLKIEKSNEFIDIEMKVSPLVRTHCFEETWLDMACIFWDIPRWILNFLYQCCWQDVFINIVRRFRSSIFFSNFLKFFYFFKSCVFIFSFFLRAMECHRAMYLKSEKSNEFTDIEIKVSPLSRYVPYILKRLHWTWPDHLGTFQEGFWIICTNFVGKMYL